MPLCSLPATPMLLPPSALLPAPRRMRFSDLLTLLVRPTLVHEISLLPRPLLCLRLPFLPPSPLPPLPSPPPTFVRSLHLQPIRMAPSIFPIRLPTRLLLPPFPPIRLRPFPLPLWPPLLPFPMVPLFNLPSNRSNACNSIHPVLLVPTPPPAIRATSWRPNLSSIRLLRPPFLLPRSSLAPMLLPHLLHLRPAPTVFPARIFPKLFAPTPPFCLLPLPRRATQLVVPLRTLPPFAAVLD